MAVIGAVSNSRNGSRLALVGPSEGQLERGLQ
jgi:hypothetical protein